MGCLAGVRALAGEGGRGLGQPLDETLETLLFQCCASVQFSLRGNSRFSKSWSLRGALLPRSELNARLTI